VEHDPANRSTFLTVRKQAIVWRGERTKKPKRWRRLHTPGAMLVLPMLDAGSARMSLRRFHGACHHQRRNRIQPGLSDGRRISARMPRPLPAHTPAFPFRYRRHGSGLRADAEAVAETVRRVIDAGAVGSIAKIGWKKNI